MRVVQQFGYHPASLIRPKSSRNLHFLFARISQEAWPTLDASAGDYGTVTITPVHGFEPRLR